MSRSSAQLHTVCRQFLHVDLRGSESIGLAMQSKLSHLCQSELASRLAMVLDQAVSPDQHVMIERIDIDAGALTLENFDIEIVAAVSTALEKALRLHIGESNTLVDFAKVRHRSAAQSIEEAFIFFLERGYLPWWFHLPVGQSLEEVLVDDLRNRNSKALSPTLLQALKGVLHKESVRKRLVAQFSMTFLVTALTSLRPQYTEDWQRLLLKNHSVSDSGEWVSFLKRVCELALQQIVDGVNGNIGELVRECWRTSPQSRRIVLEPLLSSVLAGLKRRPEKNAVSKNKELQTKSGKRSPANSLAESLDKLSATSHAKEQEQTNARKKSSVSKTRLNDSSKADLAKSIADGDNESISGDSRISIKPDSIASQPLYSKQSVFDQSYSDQRELSEGIYTSNAGVVLLHPFLSRLFETLNIAQNNELLDVDRGLKVLHFLATGQRIAQEYELVLAKFLCNLPLTATVDSLRELNEADVGEANAMLDAVIGHWQALRNSARDALRSTFLMRPGKLSQREDGDYLLQIEAQSFDILLEDLPWGIGVVTLPWMPKLLWVEWQ